MEYARLGIEEAIKHGRTDLEWEEAQLDRAETIGSNLPELWFERVHLAVARGEEAEARAAVDAAERFRDVRGSKLGEYETMIEGIPRD